MSGQIDARCGNCRYCVRMNPAKPETAHCRRYPPQNLTIPQQTRLGERSLGVVGTWPSVSEKNDSCGEYASAFAAEA